jgi:hypothetical protein
LIGRVVGKLSLCVVHDHTTDDVAGVDEDLGEDEALPEVIPARRLWSVDVLVGFS